LDLRLRLSRVVCPVVVALILAPGTASAGDVRVSVAGIRGGAGSIRVAAFRSDEALAEGRFSARAEAHALEVEAILVLGALPPGEYGFVAFQDLDGDGVISKNFFGVPTEPYGFSNGARGRLGPPPFDATRLLVPSERLEIEIELR